MGVVDVDQLAHAVGEVDGCPVFRNLDVAPRLMGIEEDEEVGRPVSLVLVAGRNVGSLTARTLRLLDLYEPHVFAAAVQELLTRGTMDPGALEVLCERHRRKHDKPAHVDVALPAHIPDRDVTPHSLENYDAKPNRRR